MTDPLTQAEVALAKMREATIDNLVIGKSMVRMFEFDVTAMLPAFEAIVAELRERREADARFKSGVTSQRSYMYGVGHNAAVLLHPDGTSEFIKPIVPPEIDDE